jgi:hypothetical protein
MAVASNDLVKYGLSYFPSGFLMMEVHKRLRLLKWLKLLRLIILFLFWKLDSQRGFIMVAVQYVPSGDGGISAISSWEVGCCFNFGRLIGCFRSVLLCYCE